MSNSALAEIYFISAMMILILVVSGVSVYFFFKTYNKEKTQKEKREKDKLIQGSKSKIQK